MFRVILRIAAVLATLAAGGVTMAGASENRVALVIGNSAYRHATALENPRNDAADMAVALERLGFRVVKGLDLDKQTMDRTLRQFAETLRGATMGMFFYAGHGLQVSGRNYLVPIDAELKSAEALDFEMVGLDVVQRIMEAASETNILFVDACRNNPLSRNLARAMGTRSAAIGQGLTAQEAGAGTLISFSTQPGNVALDGTGRNSPYAAALVKHIGTQGRDLPAVLVQVRRDVMATTAKRQIPWEHSALTADVMLVPQGAPQTLAGVREGAGSDGKQGDDTSSDPQERTAVNTIPGTDAEPAEAKQKVIKVGGVKSTLKIINNHNNEFLYNENGKKILFKSNNPAGAFPANEAVELPAGRYHIKSDADLMTIRPFEIKKGENVVVDFRKHVGSLRMINSKDNQYLFTEADKRIWIDQGASGTFNMGAMPQDKLIELPPGRYRLKSGNPLSTVEPFDIKAGEETVIDFGG